MKPEIILALINHMSPALYEDGRTPRGRYGVIVGATRKGATHKQGKVFRSRSLFGITPAEYRRRHLGAA
jgi:hypothetical protein